MFKVLIAVAVAISTYQSVACEPGSYTGDLSMAKSLENKDLDCHHKGQQSKGSGLDIFMPQCQGAKPTVFLYGFGGEQFEITSVTLKSVHGDSARYSLVTPESSEPILCDLSDESDGDGNDNGGGQSDEDLTKKTYGVFCNVREYYAESTGKDFDDLDEEEKAEIKESTAAFQEFLKNPSGSDAMGEVMACAIVNKAKAQMVAFGCKDSEGNQATATNIKKAIKYCSNQKK